MNRSFHIHGLSARAHDTNPPGICVLRFRDPAGKQCIERVGHALTPLGMEVSETLAGVTGALRICPFSWMPGPAEEIDQQRATLERVAANENIEAAWFFHSLGASADATTVDVPFPVDGHAEAVEDFDWYDFGLAIKLAPPRLAGEELVLRAFHWFWAKPLLGAFRNSDVTVDSVHRAAHFWVDRFQVSGDYAVSSVLQVAKALNEVLPIAHATFHAATMTQKYGRLVKGDDDHDNESEPFILAGNPLGAAYLRGGISAVAQWRAQQTLWSGEEVAHMLRETATVIVKGQESECEEELDPQRADSALALLDEAWRMLPADEEIQLALGQVLVLANRHHQLLEYLPSFGIAARIHLAILLGESESPQFRPAFELLLEESLPTRIVGESVSACGAASISSLGDQSNELLERLTSYAIALAPTLLPSWLARLPGRVDLLFPIAIALKQDNLRDLAAEVYATILALPPPLPSTRTREPYCRAHNNAIVLACEDGHFDIAVKLSDASQRYGFENPWIYHSAACAYACAGSLDRAYEQVALAVDHDYPYLAPDTGTKSSHYLESDRDLGALLEQPRFKDLFARWRRARGPLMEGLQALAEENPQRALPLLQQAAADSSPLARKAAGALAKAYLVLGDAKAAWDISFPAFERFPEDPELLLHLAAAGRKLGRLHDMIPLLVRKVFPASHQSVEIGRSVLKDCGQADLADALARRWRTSEGD